MKRSGGVGSNPFNIEEKRDFYIYNIVIDVDRVGKYSLEEQSNKELRDIIINEDKKKERIKQLIETMFYLKREIKGRMEDLSPWLMVVGMYNDGKYETYLDKIELSKSHVYKTITKEKESKDNEGKTIKEIADSSFNLEPVGTGPYQFSELTVENDVITGLTLKAFTNNSTDGPFLEEIHFRYYPDAQSAYQAYIDKYVQGISEIPDEMLGSALTTQELSVYTGRLPQISLVMFNLNDAALPFFQDASIRKALLLGLNRQRMVNEIFNGQAIVANGVIFPDSWAYLDSMATVEYDPEQAGMLLKEAGYVITGDENPVRMKEEIALRFVLTYPDDDLHRVIAESIQNDWKKLSIDVLLEPVPADIFLSTKLAPRAFQAALVDLNLSRTPDPDPYPFWDSGQAATGQNYSQWSNRLASDSIEQARVTMDFAERIRLYHNFQAIFEAELPSLPLYYPVYNYGVDSVIQGVSLGPLMDTCDRFASVSQWYMTARRSQGTETAAP
ncbi:MAG: hypothetical protein CVU45_00905 [Chloroflexi bacterium HGW-Chloroflexi-7]|nr:MAG: hypothetical protein CVU45_00905 [Chloroflexi bacterium HGW-Chloroflexi-7]